MNTNQQKLDSKDQELIEKVLNFSLSLNNESICFNNIVYKLELDLTLLEKSLNETLDSEQLEQIAKEIQELDEEIKKWKDIYESIDWYNISNEERNAKYADFPWRKRYPHHDLGDYIGMLKIRKSKKEKISKNNGNIEFPLLGSFFSDERKIYLYLENIKKSSCRWINSKAILTEPLITTFIHEMFHAWNYFACGKKDRTVKEIDEAMVEIATLYFLKQISQVHNEFEPILKWAERSVENKQELSGSIASYGYGYYLYSLIGGQEEIHALEILAAYACKSGDIQNSNLVKRVKAMLCPCYPFEKEREAFELIYQIIFSGVKIRKKSQEQQVIDALQKMGGYAKLQDLYKVIDTSTWRAQDPKASIRRTLQSSKECYMIRPGLWALEEYRNEIEKQIIQGNI